MNESRRPTLEPFQTNDSAAMLVGSGLWAIALVALLIAQPAADHRWWIWTCVVGIFGGIFGLWYVRRYGRASSTADHDEGGDGDGDPGSAVEVGFGEEEGDR